METIGALAITSLIAGLVIGLAALIITIVVIIRSKKYVVPLIVYTLCLLVSLALIGVFIFAWMAAPMQVSPTSNVDNNQPSDAPSNINANTNVTEVAPVEVGPSEQDYYLLAQDGKIYNEDYSFLLTVGEEHAANITEVYAVPFEGVTATYLYCYDTADAGLASVKCPGTAAEVFRVNVYTANQWEAVQDSPFVGTKMIETVDYVYEFTHPNGVLPTDVPSSETFYTSVSSSFNFAG